MALRLRRSLIFSSSLLNHLHRRPLSLSKPHYRRPHSSPSITSSSFLQSPSHFLVPSMSFRSSSFSLSQSRYSNDKEDEKISPDTILFEGCDYNHWLITMEFPKDPKPTPEEMVETYVQTLAKVVGSVEEAKKRMYACSTTTYHGFQAVMTETMSEMFRGLPGVVFILPDSYIDPVNKEYGGDKYINGTIIPRPPPVHYTRGDRNRYRTQNPMPMQQGNTRSDNRNSMQGDGRNYAPQNHYGPTGQDGRGFGPPAGRDFNPAMERRDFQQVERRDYGQAGGSDYNAQGGRRDYGQAGGSDYNAQGGRRDPMPMGGRDYAPGGYQGERREPVPSYQRDYNQGERGNYIPQERRDFSQRDQRDYPPPERRDFGGNYRDAGPSGGVDYRQRMGSGYGQGFTGPNEGQMFSQMEDRDGMQGEHRNFAPVEQPGTGQGRY